MDLINVPNLPIQLTKQQIHTELTNGNHDSHHSHHNHHNLKYKTSYLKEILNSVFDKILISIGPIIDSRFTGKEQTRNTNTQSVNPILWQFGHLILFYLNNCIRLLTNTDLLNEHKEIIQKIIHYLSIDLKPSKHINYYDYFDSFMTPQTTRMKYIKHLDIKNLRNAYTLVIQVLNIYLDNDILTNKEEYINSIDGYLIMLGILHNDMHYEAILFTQRYIGYPKPLNFNTIYLEKQNNATNSHIQSKDSILFININGGYFKQGIDINVNRNSIATTESQLSFDNERPAFDVKIDDFIVSKYPITEGQYLEFVNDNGYLNNKFWCQEGWEWLQTHKIEHPIDWVYSEIYDNTTFDFKDVLVYKKKWYKKWKHGTAVIDTYSKNPMHGMSWYEVKAYCRWANVRLLAESEWEYLATNGGTTLYPWGNEKPTNEFCNINYTNGAVINVDYFNENENENETETSQLCKGDNKDGVSQLIGNVWEWCDDVIYPYDGFKIDSVYREMSYPYMGIKRICRGGCWATSDYLITSTYRNAQDPKCCIQWIGFRVCQL